MESWVGVGNVISKEDVWYTHTDNKGEFWTRRTDLRVMGLINGITQREHRQKSEKEQDSIHRSPNKTMISSNSSFLMLPRLHPHPASNFRSSFVSWWEARFRWSQCKPSVSCSLAHDQGYIWKRWHMDWVCLADIVSLNLLQLGKDDGQVQVGRKENFWQN